MIQPNYNIESQNELTIEPLSQKTIYQRRGGWVETKPAWLAVGGKLGKQLSKHPEGPQIYSVDCKYRFCIDNHLQEFQQARLGSSFGKTINEACCKALAFALGEFYERGRCEQFEDLRYWKLALLSSNNEFLDEIEAQIKMLPDERPYFYGSGNRDPIDLLTKFENVKIVLISAEQARSIKEVEIVSIVLK